MQLTLNQRRVLRVLEEADRPLGAYAVLHHLRPHGIAAPTQIYRALDKLTEYGLVYRLASINAFVARARPGDSASCLTVFTICDCCGRIEQLASEALCRDLRQWAGKQSFVLDTRAALEIRGRCSECRTAPDELKISEQ